MARIYIPLKISERDALWELAEREHRDPRDQAALILVRELERLGYLKPENIPDNEPLGE